MVKYHNCISLMSADRRTDGQIAADFLDIRHGWFQWSVFANLRFISSDDFKIVLAAGAADIILSSINPSIHFFPQTGLAPVSGRDSAVNTWDVWLRTMEYNYLLRRGLQPVTESESDVRWSIKQMFLELDKCRSSSWLSWPQWRCPWQNICFILSLPFSLNCFTEVKIPSAVSI